MGFVRSGGGGGSFSPSKLNLFSAVKSIFHPATNPGVASDDTNSELDVSGLGTGLANVSSDGTLTGQGTTGDPLKVARPFTSGDENHLDALPALWAAGVHALGAQVSYAGKVYVCTDARTAGDTDNPTIDTESWAEVGSGGGGGLSTVETDATLTGDGSSSDPLKVANPFTDADESKLDGIEANATADQTGAEIRDALQGLSGANRLAATAIKDLPSGGGANITGGIPQSITGSASASNLAAGATQDITVSAVAGSSYAEQGTGGDADKIVITNPGTYRLYGSIVIATTNDRSGPSFNVDGDNVEVIGFDNAYMRDADSSHTVWRSVDFIVSAANSVVTLQVENRDIIDSSGSFGVQALDVTSVGNLRLLPIAGIQGEAGSGNAVGTDATLTGDGTTSDPLKVANPFTDADEAKLDGIAAGAEVNVKSDWDETDSTEDSFIDNKPSDADFGDKAFKNPPSLNTTEQEAVRTAIGAGTGSGNGGSFSPTKANLYNAVKEILHPATNNGVSPDDTNNELDIPGESFDTMRLVDGLRTIALSTVQTGMTVASAAPSSDGEIFLTSGAMRVQFAASVYTAAKAILVNGAYMRLSSGSDEVIFRLAQVAATDGSRQIVARSVTYFVGSNTTLSAGATATLEVYALDGAEIGDLAFSNPPSDLTDDEKTAVRTAIGAGTGSGGGTTYDANNRLDAAFVGSGKISDAELDTLDGNDLNINASLRFGILEEGQNGLDSVLETIRINARSNNKVVNGNKWLLTGNHSLKNKVVRLTDVDALKATTGDLPNTVAAVETYFDVLTATHEDVASLDGVRGNVQDQLDRKLNSNAIDDLLHDEVYRHTLRRVSTGLGDQGFHENIIFISSGTARLGSLLVHSLTVETTAPVNLDGSMRDNADAVRDDYQWMVQHLRPGNQFQLDVGGSKVTRWTVVSSNQDTLNRMEVRATLDSGTANYVQHTEQITFTSLGNALTADLIAEIAFENPPDGLSTAQKAAVRDAVDALPDTWEDTIRENKRVTDVTKGLVATTVLSGYTGRTSSAVYTATGKAIAAATLGNADFLYFRDEDNDIDDVVAAFEAGDTIVIRNPDGDIVLEAIFNSSSDVSASNSVVLSVDFILGEDTSIVPDGSVEYSAETRNVNDASIGDRAFSNPPSDLSDAEKTAARNAIGAGTGGGQTLTDAQIGDKAFSNPPSDLDTTEQAAVRTAIAAGAALTDAQIGDRAFSNPPSDLDATEQGAVREAIGVENLDVETQATRGEKLAIQNAGSTSTRLAADTRLKPATTNPVSVIHGDGNPELITGTDDTSGAETFTLAGGLRLVEIRGDANTSGNRGQFGLAIKQQSDGALVGDGRYTASGSGWRSFDVKMLLPLEEDTECYLEFDHQNNHDFAFRNVEVDVYRVGGIQGNDGPGLFDYSNLPDASEYEDGSIIVFDDIFYEKQTGHEDHNTFAGTTGRGAQTITHVHWRGAATRYANDYSPALIGGNFHATGSFSSNPGGAIGFVLASSNGDGTGDFLASIRKTTYDAAKGSAYADGDTLDFVFNRFSASLAAETIQATGIGTYTSDGVEWVVFSATNHAKTYNLYQQSGDGNFSFVVNEAGTSTAFLTHTAEVQHWVHWINEDAEEDRRDIETLREALEVEQQRAAGEEARIRLAIEQAKIDSGHPLAAFPTDPDSDPTRFVVDEGLSVAISIPAALNPTNAAFNYSPSILPGEYRVTTGLAVNQGIMRIDRIKDNDIYYYGAYLHRGWLDAHFSSTDAPDTTDGLIHNPLSGMIGMGLYAPINRNLSSYDVYQMQIRHADWDMMIDLNNATYIYVHFWNMDGTKRSEVLRFALQASQTDWHRNGVQFLNMTNLSQNKDLFFKEIYDANPGDSNADRLARQLRFSFAGSASIASDSAVWQMGFGKMKGYTLQPEVTLARAVRVLSLTQAQYDALTTKDASVFYNITDA